MNENLQNANRPNLTELQTLSHLSRDEADHVLSDIADKFLPHPFDDDRELLSENPSLVESTLQEIRQVLGLGASDDSQQARTKLLGYLADTIGKMSPDEEEVVKQRLIDKGMLTPEGRIIALTTN